MEGGPSALLRGILMAGLAFLYLPVLVLIVLSFDASEIVTVWGGFSTRWYRVLAGDRELLRATWLSLEIAACAASGALVVGTLAAYALARYRSFRGRVLFSALIAAPLVMPEIVTGLGLLLLFIGLRAAIGWPAGRGFVTITLAHMTFCSAFVAAILQSRLAGMDISVEEAAADLDARPLAVFVLVTLPSLAPALAAAWLLAFALSVDDVVISEFAAGPRSTTLPMIVFSTVRHGVSPEVNALATLLVLAVAIGTVGVTLVSLRRRSG